MFRYAAVLLSMLASPSWAEAPKFSAFPAKAYTGQVAKPVLNDADKKMYRTRLKAAAERSPNFAGQFILAGWGCGTSCVFGAVLNAKTGEVLFLPATVCCSDVQDRIEFKPDSRLIILHGMLNEEEPNQAHYFEFTGKTFNPL